MRSNSVMSGIGRCLVVVFSLALSACSWHVYRELPLPQLPADRIELRVAHVVNPRLPRMSPEQLRILLATIETTAKDHFGVTLRFAPIDELPMDALFRKVPADRWQEFRGYIYDFKTGTGDAARLERILGEEFRGSGEPLLETIEFARPHVGDLTQYSYESLGAALAKVLLRRIEEWKGIKAPDGAPAIDASPYNELLMWVALGYGEMSYELVLTNQLIVSTEYGGASAHTAVRGGYTNGITTYNKLSRFGTYSVWSTFAFTANDDLVKRLREGETYTPDEAARLAGMSATHEIGHQLFHLLHPYGRSACVMNPVPMLAYRAWAAKLSARDCPIGSDAAMQPGASRFRY